MYNDLVSITVYRNRYGSFGMKLLNAIDYYDPLEVKMSKDEYIPVCGEVFNLILTEMSVFAALSSVLILRSDNIPDSTIFDIYRKFITSTN